MDQNECGPIIYISNLKKFSDRIVTTKINWFIVHFSSYFAGLILIKIRNKYCPASGGIDLQFQQENTRRLKIVYLAHGTFSDTHFFLHIEGQVRTILGPHSLYLGASFFRLSNTRSSCSSRASPLRWCWQRTQFSSVRMWGSDHSSRSGHSSIP